MNDRKQLGIQLDEAARLVDIAHLRRLRSVQDFLIDADEAQWEGKELACRALDQLCESDHQKVDMAIVLGVIVFLETKTGQGPATDEECKQRALDCIRVASARESYEQCRTWADAWFG
ncbi:MAG: hypothetical protein IIA67_01010 [Planctomycetes bacterium]|nr:hypothetical protein [Planctomycetota bacterium]